ISTIKAGASFKKFTNSGFRYDATANYENCDVLASIPTMLTNHSTALPYVDGDVAAIFKALGQSGNLDARNLADVTDYSVEEQTASAFGQYDLDTEVGPFG